jgi:hypothetical protein
MECSSKEMRGVDEIFERAILTVVANDRKNVEAAASHAKTSEGRTSMPGVGVPKRKKRKCQFL